MSKDIKTNDINDLEKQVRKKIHFLPFPKDIYDMVYFAKNNLIPREMLINRINRLGPDFNFQEWPNELMNITGSFFGISLKYDEKDKTKEYEYVIFGNFGDINPVVKELSFNLFKLRLNFFEMATITDTFECQTMKNCPILRYLCGDIDYEDLRKLRRYSQFINYKKAIKTLGSSANYIAQLFLQCYPIYRAKKESESKLRMLKKIVNDPNLFY